MGLPSFWLTHVNNKWFSSSLRFGNCFLHLLQVKASAVKSWWQSVKWFHCSGSLMEIGILQYEQKSWGKVVKFIWCCRFEFHMFWVVNSNCLLKNWKNLPVITRTDTKELERTNKNFRYYEGGGKFAPSQTCQSLWWW